MTIFHSFFNSSSRWYYPLRWLVLILLGLAIYAQTFGYNFVFDDFLFIVNNPYLKRFDNVHYIWNSFPKTRTIGFYSFTLNYLINQLHPQGYHFLNVVIHFLAVGLVWATATLIFKTAGSGRIHQEFPFIIALLFLVHPCQTQAVAYISQRFESMATFFYLGSIYCYLSARLSSSSTHKIYLFACSAGCAILGIFTKEVALTIPLMIVAVEWILFNKNPENFRKSSSGLFYLSITILGAVFVLLFLSIVRTNPVELYFHFSAPSESHDGDMITGGKYVLTQMRVFLTFVRLLILPINQNLDYDYPLSTGLLNPPLTLVGLCLIGFIIFLIFRLRKEWPIIAFGLAWILITFSINTAPRSNVIFEHKLYLISFGFFLSAVCAISTIIKDRRILFGLLIALIAVLSLVSYKRNHVWKNELTLWDDVVQKSSHKARPYNNRASAYIQQNNLIQALSDYNKAIEINPGYPEAYDGRGNVYRQQGDFTKALPEYNKAIAINPNYSKAYFNRGFLFYNQDNLIQALSDYNKAIAINPENAEALNNRGIVYYNQGDLTKAISDYNKSIEKAPYYVEAYYNRGIVYDQEGFFTQALSDYNKTIEINPNVEGAYYNRGLLFAKQGNYAKAIFDFTKAIEMTPMNAEVYISRGDIYAQQADFIQAISDYSKAIEIEPNNARAYNNRGLMYYNRHNLTQAMSDYNKAIAINSQDAQVHYNRAVIYYQLRQYDKAWGDAHKVESLGIKINPKFIDDLKKVSGKDK